MLKCFNKKLAQQMRENPPELPYEFGGPPSAEKLAAEQGHDAAVGLEWGRESYKIATALWRLKKRE